MLFPSENNTLISLVPIVRTHQRVLEYLLFTILPIFWFSFIIFQRTWRFGEIGLLMWSGTLSKSRPVSKIWKFSWGESSLCVLHPGDATRSREQSNVLIALGSKQMEILYQRSFKNVTRPLIMNPLGTVTEKSQSTVWLTSVDMFITTVLHNSHHIHIISSRPSHAIRARQWRNRTPWRHLGRRRHPGRDNSLSMNGHIRGRIRYRVREN